MKWIFQKKNILNINSISTNLNNNNENKNFGLIAAVFFALRLSDCKDKSQINSVTMAVIYNIYGLFLEVLLL